jgi:hypothetical protein
MTSVGTVEQVSKTIHTALRIYEDTCKRFQSDGAALIILQNFRSPLDHLEDRLGFVLDNEEACQRLDEISVGDQAHARKLLEALESDVQFVSTYLRDVGRPGQSRLDKDDVDVYTDALVRYSKVLKLVLKKNTKYVIFVFFADSD